MNKYTESIRIAAANLNEEIKTSLDAILVLGSGLNSICDGLTVKHEIAYKNIKGLAVATAPNHAGKLLICEITGKNVAVCNGRLHLYEGYSAQQVAMLTYILSACGAKQLVITNAAGALNANYRPGEIMVITDHINFTGQNPIIGQGDELGQRFTDMSQAYCSDLSAHALRVGSELGLPVHSGIYAGVAGPSLETSAERRMLCQWGADAVGMSTVMEVIAANHCGLQVLGLSAITNLAVGDANQQADTEEQILHYADIAAVGIKQIINANLTK